MTNNVKLYTSDILKEKYWRAEHDSGLSVYVFPKDMSGSYAILSAKFGGAVSSYMRDGEHVTIPLGCAHFLEHKMFDNEGRAGADDIFSALGAYDNAYTSNDRTAYLFSCSDNFSECLTELLRFVTEPYFTEASVKKEIGIIAEEIRGCLDDPYDRCHMDLLKAMYHASNVRNEICGTERSISEITPEILYSCCEDFYHPSNMVLTVCGNVSVDEVMDVVSSVLSNDRRRHDISVCTNNEPSHVLKKYTERKMDVGRAIQCIGIKDANIPADATERLRRIIAVNLLCKILFAESGEFYLDMLNKEIFTPNFDCGYSANKDTGYILIWDESSNEEALLESIKQRIEDVKMSGIDLESFEREKRAAYAAYVSDFDSTEDIAFALLSYAGEELDIFEYPSILDSVDVKYIEGILKEMFEPDRFAMSVIKPM